MSEKIMIEFTAEEMDKILEYQKELQELTDEEFLKKFPSKGMDTVQKAIMNAVELGILHPMIVC